MPTPYDPHDQPLPGESVMQWARRTTRLLPTHVTAWKKALDEDREATEAKIRLLPRLDRSEAFLAHMAAQHLGPLLVRNSPEYESRPGARAMTEGSLW